MVKPWPTTISRRSRAYSRTSVISMASMVLMATRDHQDAGDDSSDDDKCDQSCNQCATTTQNGCLPPGVSDGSCTCRVLGLLIRVICHWAWHLSLVWICEE